MKLQLAMAVALAVLLSTWLAASATGGGRSNYDHDALWHTCNVSIINNLKGRETMGLHCKDKNHDLGSHQLPYGDTYKFKVTGAWHNTDFFCGFSFDGVLHWFDIYLGKRDMFECGADCRWNITGDGPCRLRYPFGQGAPPPKCFPWNHDDANATP